MQGRGSGKLLTWVISSLLIFLSVLFLFIVRFKHQEQESVAAPSSSSEKGIVTAVFDGDTIRVKLNNGSHRKVRLIGVNAPEIGDKRKKVKFHAFLAKRFSFYYLYKKRVELSFDWQREDKYGRLLAYVWIGEELFNNFIIREGFASAFLKYPFRKDYQKIFMKSEKYARKMKKGLWIEGDFPVISTEEARSRLGELVCVKFRCLDLESKRNFLFLCSGGERDFAALIPQENLNSFQKPGSFLNKNLLVSGFLEEFYQQPQVVVYFPDQVKIEEEQGPEE